MTTHHPLDALLADGIIDEILGRLKSGKEADIYLVRHAGEAVAAKVYKDAARRSFKNNADYKEGRSVRNSRTRRAIESGSRFGRDAEESAWKTAEVNALQLLHSHGVRVPRPILFYEGVLLLELVTDRAGRPAPRLVELSLTAAEARALYLDLRAQLVRILCCEVIHGDLSPYNILAAEAGPTIIDLPQVVSAAHSSRSEFFFQRDFQNLHGFLAEADRSLGAHRDDGRKIWQAWVRRDLSPDWVPSVGAEPERRDRPRRSPPPPPAPRRAPSRPQRAARQPAPSVQVARRPAPRPPVVAVAPQPTERPRRRRRRRR